MADYHTCLQHLEENTRLIDVAGLPVTIKPVPDEDLPGAVDPRVRAVRTQPPSQVSEVDPYTYNGIPIGAMRQKMGWANADITAGDVRTQCRTIDGKNGPIGLFIYTASKAKPGCPCLVFIHDGGFFGGSCKTVENPCKAIAEKAKCVVVSVDYRLAPEHPYPQGFEDCFDAVTWVYNHARELEIDPHKIGVAGDSAGGNLSAVCTLKDRDLGSGMIHYQALIYPTVDRGPFDGNPYYDWTLDAFTFRPEDEQMARQCALGIYGVDANSTALYLTSPGQVDDPYASPLRAEDFKGLPKSLIVVAEFDSLRLQCEAYARRLMDDGVEVRMLRYNGMDHAFIDKCGLYPQAEDCYREIAQDLKSL